MNFKLNKSTGIATSECGFYEIRSALNNARTYYNAYYLPSHRSLEGTYEKDAAKLACQKHADKMLALKEAVTGESK